MNDRTVIEREPVELPVLPGIDDALWPALLELAEIQPRNWTLVGGQMVLLHALENGARLPRVSTDLDVLVNARVATSAVRDFVRALQERGFEPVGMSPEGVVHRFMRDGVSVDVLAPERLGERADLTTVPPGRTLQSPGGSQALRRTEMVPVRFREQTGLVPRPSLLGAIICKAEAVGVDDAPINQRLDLTLLLSLVDDPLAMSDEMVAKDRQRLRRRSELGDPAHRSWTELDPDAADRGLAAYRLLTR
ncbi:MAG: hypothetical protein OXI97_12080 [Acidimicrobiaceae bacterium]|nr:hypothetical protein [Acidimicrobiaceae bacterium]